VRVRADKSAHTIPIPRANGRALANNKALRSLFHRQQWPCLEMWKVQITEPTTHNLHPRLFARHRHQNPRLPLFTRTSHSSNACRSIRPPKLSRSMERQTIRTAVSLSHTCMLISHRQTLEHILYNKLRPAEFQARSRIVWLQTYLCLRVHVLSRQWRF
jgi:hypothetical protein